MGTNCSTTIYENDQPLLSFQKTSDGYPKGHGRELHRFLSSIRMVRWLTGDISGVSNGTSCLAAQMIASFKKCAGDLYIERERATREYNYDLYYDTMSETHRLTRIVVSSRETILFEGDLEGFHTYVVACT